MRIAVCIHLFYLDMFSEIKTYLQSLRNYEYDLFVTLPHENNYFANELRKHYPNVTIITTENIGFDIYPFLCFLRHIQLDSYDLIFKLHSKKDIPINTIINGYNLNGKMWRYYLFSSILYSERRVKKIIDIFTNQPHVGMIGAKELLICGEDIHNDIDMNKVEAVMHQCNLSLSEKEFIAGSMFVVRANLLNSLKQRCFTSNEFPPYLPRDWNSLPYCLERYFGCMVSSQGYQLLGLSTPLSFSQTATECKFSIKVKSLAKKYLPKGFYKILKFINARTLKWY